MEGLVVNENVGIITHKDSLYLLNPIFIRTGQESNLTLDIRQDTL